MSEQFHSATFIVGCASGNGGLLDALLPWAHAGLLAQVKTETAAVICEKYGLKPASLSVLQKLPKETWSVDGKRRPNPATTIYTYIQALLKCGRDFGKMAALTPSGIVKSNKTDGAEKTPRKTADKPEAPTVTLTVDDAIRFILTAHSVVGLSVDQYAALASIVAPVQVMPIAPRVDIAALTH